MNIFNGTYTIENPHTGNHRTFKISTQPDDAAFAPGQRIIELLIGENNETDFKGFGFVTDSGIKVWKRFQGTKDCASVHEQYANMVWSMGTEGEASGYAKKGLKLLLEKRCLRCNRKLTTPESIERGIGPECAAKLAFALNR